jgi:hypothetical protein
MENTNNLGRFQDPVRADLESDGSDLGKGGRISAFPSISNESVPKSDIFEQSRFYLVCCKCGHVGSGCYLPLIFPIRAKTKKEAAAAARQKPGVKHHSPGAVIWVRSVDKEDYYLALSVLRQDIYWLKLENYTDILRDRIKRENKQPRLRMRRKKERKHYIAQVREIEIARHVKGEYGIVV